jgi:hypothetical protein
VFLIRLQEMQMEEALNAIDWDKNLMQMTVSYRNSLRQQDSANADGLAQGTDDLLPTITDTGSSDLSRSPNAATKKGKQGKPARRRMSSLASFLAQEEVDKQAAADLEKTSRKISSDEARMNEWLADVSVSVHMIQVWTFVSILWSCRQR